SIILTPEEDARPHFKEALDYLRGEAARQEGDAAMAARFWQPVADGPDRLYHTKASLALTLLRLQQNEITLQDALDALESLRYAWRGDGLEVQILHRLGLLKVQNGEYLAGLQDMETAVRLLEDAKWDSS